MTDTSGLKFSSAFIDPQTGILQRWAYQYLLNPSVSNINVATGGTFNAPGATVVAKAISLGVPVRPSSGGTGISSGTSGGVLGFTSATTVASSALLNASQIVFGGGAGATPSTPLGLGSAHVVLHGNAAGVPTWSAVDVTADVTGALPVANGGTGTNASGATAANNIGALAIASNLSDLNNAGTARTNLGLGTIATENANAVAITGGAIDGATVGATTPSTGKFSTLTATSTFTATTGTIDGTTVGVTTPAAAKVTTLTATGAVTFTSGTIDGIVIGGSTEAAASFTGVTFNAGTQLTQYVEGTFTPTLVSTGGGLPTYGVQVGFYTRIGNRVLFSLRLTISALNTLAAGNLSISGLPITSNATANNTQVQTIQCNNLAATAVTEIFASIASSATSIGLGKYAAGTTSSLTQGDITGTAIFNVSGQYQV